MKIILTRKETKSIKELYKGMEGVVEGITEELIDNTFSHLKEKCSDNKNKMINVSLNIKLDTVIDINEEYVCDFLELYGEVLKLAVPQTIALIKTIYDFINKTDKLAQKYME